LDFDPPVGCHGLAPLSSGILQEASQPVNGHPSSRPSMLMPSLRGTPLKAGVRWAPADGLRGSNPNKPSRAAPKRQLRSRAPAKTASIASVQSELSDESWIGPDLTSLDALDDVSQYRVGAASYSDLLALAHDQPIKKFDLRAPALLHILAHR